VVPEYDFKCIDCGVFVVSSHDAGFAPSTCEIWCPLCKRDTLHERQFSFGVPKGASGEGLRRAGLRPRVTSKGTGVPEVLQEESQAGAESAEEIRQSDDESG